MSNISTGQLRQLFEIEASQGGLHDAFQWFLDEAKQRKQVSPQRRVAPDEISRVSVFDLQLPYQISQRLAANSIRCVGQLLELTEELLREHCRLTEDAVQLIKGALSAHDVQLGSLRSGTHQEVRLIKAWELLRNFALVSPLICEVKEMELVGIKIGKTRLRICRCDRCGGEMVYVAGTKPSQPCEDCRTPAEIGSSGHVSSSHSATPRSDREYHGSRFHSGEW